ncbi:MAG TPA: fibronectin type III domain-containing protein [Ornithinicoccus sp.]|nr:fibronectin type III domain-containing protein [Ornithinicoccus sp.]
MRVKGTKGRTYWVEYRTRSGLDGKISPGLAGVQIRLGKPGAYYGDSSVLDMLPAADSDWFDHHTVALGAKASWTSPEGIRFTVRSTGKTAKVTVKRKSAKAKKPSSPTAKVAAADLGAKVSLGYPKDNGSPVLAYQVRVRSSDGTTATHEVSQLLGPARSVTLTDLDPTKTYAISVRATNERGASGWSKAVSVKPLDVRPTVTFHAPAKGANVKGTVRVELTPTLAKGSAS